MRTSIPRIVLAVGMIATVVWSASPVSAGTEGQADPSFNGNGYRLTNVGTFDRGMAVALQGTKVVLGGSAQITPANETDFVIVRYRSDGTVDPSFAKNGRRVVDFAGRQDSLQDLLVLPNGTIVAVGTVRVAGNAAAFGLVRLTAGGALDKSFGGDGRVTTRFGPGEAQALALLAVGNAKVVAGGQLRDPGSGTARFALSRYTSKGRLDDTFSGDGRVLTAFRGGNEESAVSGLARYGDAGVLATGTSEAGPPRVGQRGFSGEADIALAVYRSNGSLNDLVGGGDGKAIHDFGGQERVRSVVALPNTFFVVGGEFTDGGDRDLMLAKFNASGNEDFSFGGGDAISIQDVGPSEELTGLARTAGGTLTASGKVSAEGMLARFSTTTGGLDLTFDGGVTTPFSLPYPDYFEDLAVQANGRIVVGGWATVTAPDERFLVGRALAA